MESDDSDDVEYTPTVEPFNMEDLMANSDADLLEESYLALYETLQDAAALSQVECPSVSSRS